MSRDWKPKSFEEVDALARELAKRGDPSLAILWLIKRHAPKQMLAYSRQRPRTQ